MFGKPLLFCFLQCPFATPDKQLIKFKAHARGIKWNIPEKEQGRLSHAAPVVLNFLAPISPFKISRTGVLRHPVGIADSRWSYSITQLPARKLAFKGTAMYSMPLTINYESYHLDISYFMATLRISWVVSCYMSVYTNFSRFAQKMPEFASGMDPTNWKSSQGPSVT